MSEQMQVLHSITKLNDVGVRLRYLTARQIESTFSGMFPFVSVYPFGSSVNGYGRMGCDLDLVLRLIDRKVNTYYFLNNISNKLFLMVRTTPKAGLSFIAKQLLDPREAPISDTWKRLEI